MKKSENKSWTKRITAVVLAACMVLTTPVSLLADDMAEEGEVQAAAEDEFTSGDIETESSDISEQSKADGENENQTNTDNRQTTQRRRIRRFSYLCSCCLMRAAKPPMTRARL